MADHVSFLMLITFFIFIYDQKVIGALQRQGKYDPDTHQTLLSRIIRGLLFFFWPARKPSASELTPPGDLSQYKYDQTVCLDKKGTKTRLSYFFDENQHAWYKIEKINDRGSAISTPKYEPATMKFEDMKLQFV